MRSTSGARAAALAVVLLACGRFGGVDESEGRPDAGTGPTGDAGGADAATEATTLDGGGDATFCTTIDAAFCEDFDRVATAQNALPPGWLTYLDPGNVVGIVAEGRSLPNAFEVEGTSPNFAEGYVRVMQVGAENVAVEVALGIDVVPAPDAFLQVTWNDDAASLRHGFTIELPGGGAGMIQEIKGPVNGETRGAIAVLNRPLWTVGWHRVVIEIDWATANLARVVLDGSPIGETKMAAAFTPGELYVELGAYGFAAASAPKRIRYDDLVVRAR
jgi:hypothetical protein